MMDMVGGISAIGAAGAATGPGAPAAPASGFLAAMERAVESVNQDVAVAETSLQQLASGQPVEVHDVMIALEKARIGVQTVIQIRNRMVEAYQDLMRMQI